MKVCVLALALLFATAPLEAKKIKKSSAAKGYKSKRSSHSSKTHKSSSKARHTSSKVS